MHHVRTDRGSIVISSRRQSPSNKSPRQAVVQSVAERIRAEASCPWIDAPDRPLPHRAMRRFAGAEELRALGSSAPTAAEARGFRQQVLHARYGGLEISIDRATPHRHTFAGDNFAHHHPLTRLTIMLDGMQHVSVDGQRRVMTSGSGTLIPGHLTTEVDAHTLVTRLNIDIPTDEEFALVLANVGVGYWPAHTPALEAFGAFVRALLARTRDSDAWVDRVAVRRLMRATVMTTIVGAPPFTDHIDDPGDYRTLALDVIRHQHTDPSLTPEKVAEQLGLSLRTVQRAFGSDRPMSQWITQARVDHALTFLAGPHYAGMSVEEISHRCGFPSTAIFRRALKNSTGLTPSEYRARHSG
jgi:AraC-like DNA-binding protein